MKNHIVTIILMITCMLSLSGCKDKETEIQDVPMMGSHILFGYDELTEHAKIIAKVKITDTLTTQNSFSLNDPKTGSMGGFYGKRTCEVLEYYKDVTGEYIIFLSDGTASGDMSIISCNNGVVRLSLEEEYMNYPEIAEHAMSELL